MQNQPETPPQEPQNVQENQNHVPEPQQTSPEPVKIGKIKSFVLQKTQKIREFKWTKENLKALAKHCWQVSVAFIKKYGNIQTWKDSMIPEHPEYNERLKHFFVMVMGGVMTLIFILVILFMLIAGISAPRVRMPDLANKDIVDAVRLVQGEKLSPSFDIQFDSEFPRFTVIGQYPSAGLSVRQGRKVTIIVSMGQDTYLVPDLAGLNITEAEDLLKKGNIPYQILIVPAGNSPVNTVIGQNYTADAKIPREKTLIVTATQDTKSGEYRLENFARQNLDFALIRLLNNKLIPEIVRTNVNSISEDGMVLAQSVEPDTIARANMTVRLSVGVYARDQGEFNMTKWGYIRYRFPLAENQGIQEITTNEEGSNVVIVTGRTATAKYFRVEVEDELGRKTLLYERNGGEGSTIIRAFKYYGNSKVVVTADGYVIDTLYYQ